MFITSPRECRSPEIARNTLGLEVNDLVWQAYFVIGKYEGEPATLQDWTIKEIVYSIVRAWLTTKYSEETFRPCWNLVKEEFISKLPLPELIIQKILSRRDSTIADFLAENAGLDKRALQATPEYENFTTLENVLKYKHLGQSTKNKIFGLLLHPVVRFY